MATRKQVKATPTGETAKKDGNRSNKKVREAAKKGPKVKAERRVGPSGTGRPMVIFDWGLIDKLCSAQCTGEEIAAYYDCDYDTLDRACKRERRMGFADYFDRKRKVGFVSLRAKRWQRAMEGDNTLMIYLSKALLGETDRVQVQHSGDPQHPVEHVIEMRLQKGDGTTLVIGEKALQAEEAKANGG